MNFSSTWVELDTDFKNLVDPWETKQFKGRFEITQINGSQIQVSLSEASAGIMGFFGGSEETCLFDIP